jgi:hypothetical protein
VLNLALISLKDAQIAFPILMHLHSQRSISYSIVRYTFRFNPLETDESYVKQWQCMHSSPVEMKDLCNYKLYVLPETFRERLAIK